MFRGYAAFLALCLIASRGSAQAVIVGQVVHRATRAPLARVSAELLGARDSVIASAISAKDGGVTLPAPSAGSYRVRFTARDAEPETIDSVLAEPNARTQTFAIVATARAYFDFQVDRRASLARGSRTAPYPPELRALGIEGCVYVQFVVDESGRADAASVVVLQATLPAFAAAVRAVLPEQKFVPAKLDGRTVRQVVQQPYEFAIAEVRRVETGHAVTQIDGAGAATAGRIPRRTTSVAPPRRSVCAAAVAR